MRGFGRGSAGRGQVCRRRRRIAAKPARPEERDGRRLGHCGHKFGDDDLSVAGPEIRDQDLVDPGIEGAATTAGLSSEHAAVAAAAAAVTATAAGAGSAAPTTAEAAANRASRAI